MIYYRIPIFVVARGVKYGCFAVEWDDDLQILFHCRRQFPEVRTTELFIEIADPIASSGGSAPNPRPVNVGGEDERGESRSIVGFRVAPDPPSFEVAPDPDPHVGEALMPDDSDDEPDSGSSNGAQVSQGSNIPAEFHVGQSFHSKEEAVIAVKNYNIRRGVEYKVMESDHVKYMGKSKEFGNGCTWLIRPRSCLKHGKGSCTATPMWQNPNCIAQCHQSGPRRVSNGQLSSHFLVPLPSFIKRFIVFLCKKLDVMPQFS
ncbi:hypothetical protein PIB30_041843 [Stylosanthes scabra]|uniref:Transposase MuDR plant domain-containing protein n=1 Tax=Stylosanthes scabra TaxID=79078 RepID=A0ABU6SG25_9FABA|nr:hypothetical protein [Stylosanthes scabra]